MSLQIIMDAFLVVLSSSLCELALSSYLWSLVQFDRLVHFLKKFFHEPRNFSCFFISLIIVVVLGSINAYNLYAYTLPHKRKIDLKRETNVLFYAEKFVSPFPMNHNSLIFNSNYFSSSLIC